MMFWNPLWMEWGWGYSFFPQLHIALAEGAVRLVGEGPPNEGIVELYSRQYGWSTICTTDWDDSDARVACMQLGYMGGRSTTSRWVWHHSIILIIAQQCHKLRSTRFLALAHTLRPVMCCYTHSPLLLVKPKMKRVHVISATDSQVCIQRSSFVWPSDESLAGDRGYTLEMALLRDFNTQTQAWPCCFYPPSVPVPPFVLMRLKCTII